MSEVLVVGKERIFFEKSFRRVDFRIRLYVFGFGFICISCCVVLGKLLFFLGLFFSF